MSNPLIPQKPTPSLPPSPANERPLPGAYNKSVSHRFVTAESVPAKSNNSLDNDSESNAPQTGDFLAGLIAAAPKKFVSQAKEVKAAATGPLQPAGQAASEIPKGEAAAPPPPTSRLINALASALGGAKINPDPKDLKKSAAAEDKPIGKPILRPPPPAIPPQSRNRFRWGPATCSIPADAEVTAANAICLAELNLNVETVETYEADLQTGLPVLDAEENFTPWGQPATMKAREQEWLDSAGRWAGKGRLSSNWKGVRQLGAGGFGIAGLWEWQGPEDDKATEWERHIKHIVVKQMRPVGGPGLREEAAWQHKFSATGTKHIPMVYKGVFRDVGSGARNIPNDVDTREVHRLFMEFVPGGDLFGFIEKRTNACSIVGVPNFLPEDRVWSIFMCLVKAALVMERGRESPVHDKKGFNRETPFIHLDMKPDNVFVGLHDNSEHSREVVVKIGDFGLGREALPIPMQSDKYKEGFCTGGTHGFFTPEQIGFGPHRFQEKGHVQLRDCDFGSCTNVYGIGTVMYCLITYNSTFDPSLNHPAYISHLSTRLRAGLTRGPDIEDGIIHPRHPRHGNGTYRSKDRNGEIPKRIPLPYSQHLKAAILECLMQTPRNRPSLEQLYEAIKRGIAIANDSIPADDQVKAREAIAAVNVPPTPKDWLFKINNDDWQQDKTGQQLFKPLPQVLARVRRDKQRFVQIVAARKFLGQIQFDHVNERAMRYQDELLGKRKRKAEPYLSPGAKRRAKELALRAGQAAVGAAANIAGRAAKGALGLVPDGGLWQKNDKKEAARTRLSGSFEEITAPKSKNDRIDPVVQRGGIGRRGLRAPVGGREGAATAAVKAEDATVPAPIWKKALSIPYVSPQSFAAAVADPTNNVDGVIDITLKVMLPHDKPGSPNAVKEKVVVLENIAASISIDQLKVLLTTIPTKVPFANGNLILRKDAADMRLRIKYSGREVLGRDCGIGVLKPGDNGRRMGVFIVEQEYRRPVVGGIDGIELVEEHVDVAMAGA